MKNSNLRLILLAAGCWMLAVVSGCAKPVVKAEKTPFPAVMVGAWAYYLNMENYIQVTFDENGNIPEIVHYVFGPMVIQDGGVTKDGPDPGTYMEGVLGPVTSEYDLKTNKLKVTITIEAYTMQFVEGKLKGRIIDVFEGPVSADGAVWNAEWRSYGWLEGAAEPPVDVIDANPTHIVFQKAQKI